MYCCPKLKFKKITCDYFLYGYGGLKIANLANSGQLSRNIFRAINAYAEI